MSSEIAFRIAIVIFGALPVAFTALVLFMG
jgi:hypothetical protein